MQAAHETCLSKANKTIGLHACQTMKVNPISFQIKNETTHQWRKCPKPINKNHFLPATLGMSRDFCFPQLTQHPFHPFPQHSPTPTISACSFTPALALSSFSTPPASRSTCSGVCCLRFGIQGEAFAASSRSITCSETPTTKTEPAHPHPPTYYYLY